MKTITKLIITLLLLSTTLFAGTPNLDKLKALVGQVMKNEKMVLALDSDLPKRNTLTSESKVELIKTVKSSVKKWKVSYTEMRIELKIVSEYVELEKKLTRYIELKKVLQDTSREYREYMNQSKDNILVEVTNYWEENLKARTWYIDMENGSNTNDGLSDTTAFERFEHLADLQSIIAGDTILIMGEYANVDFDEEGAWKSTSTLSLSKLHGTADKYITIKPYDSNTVLRGNAGTILRIFDCSYIQVEGFEIYGEVERISLHKAKKYQFRYKDENGTLLYRVKDGTSIETIATMEFKILTNITRPSITDTKGLYVSGSNHINIVGNTISYMPGTGLRVAKSDYINIVENEVHHCSMRSYSGTHALVVHSSKSIDKATGYKIKILRNRIHHNYNEIFSWSPSKEIITPHIDEGKGISLQKNIYDTGWKHGRILVANNVAYNNGFSGITNNGGERIDIFNNTCYMNSQSSDDRGKNIGISSSGGKDINITNNIIQSDLNHVGYAISVTDNRKLTVFNNLIKGKLDSDLDANETQTIIGEPRFVDVANFDFRLDSDSDAQDKAIPIEAVEFDMGMELRDLNSPDLGAWED